MDLIDKKIIMYPLSYLVKESLPNYLASLPIPDTIGGWFRLGSNKCLSFRLKLKIKII